MPVFESAEPLAYNTRFCTTDRRITLCRCWTAGLHAQALMALTLSMAASAALTAAYSNMPWKISHPPARPSSPLQPAWMCVQAKVLPKLHLASKSKADTL